MARKVAGRKSVASRKASRKSGQKAAASSSPARKLTPLKSLTPAYAKRLKQAAKQQGVTVTQLRKAGAGAARGHKVAPGRTEASIRREREERRIEAFAREQAMRSRGSDPDAIAAGLRERIKEHGYSWFVELQRWVADKHKQYMAQTDRDRRGRRPSLGEDLDNDYPDDEPEWRFYH
jgi:hypothetical protein